MKSRIKSFLLLSVVYLVIGMGGGFILESFISDEYFRIYPAIIIFFWAFGLVLNLAMEGKNVYSDLFQIFFNGKILKLLFTFIFLVVYVYATDAEKKPFAISLMCNYLIYTILEIYIFSLYSKRIAKNEKNK